MPKKFGERERFLPFAREKLKVKNAFWYIVWNVGFEQRVTLKIALKKGWKAKGGPNSAPSKGWLYV